ncbi:DUF4440 domain-containing protein [Aquisalimonas sp.]|uniref:DUF4440 domain-containing protein n=1 Tax=Aquisalimonas sp. TaxID=1872621 RepID=UPI0025BBD19F|nr:DUF4440 domain-containing protein [Aquisalimonas sp.]
MGGQFPIAAAHREVEALHAFFQSWFRGDASSEAFQRLEQALADGFVIVTPDARILERRAIIDGVCSQYATDPHAQLEIRRISPRTVRGPIAIVTYEEWQARQGGPMRGRLSTVVLQADTEGPNGLRWLHVHETWLPECAENP